MENKNSNYLGLAVAFAACAGGVYLYFNSEHFFLRKPEVEIPKEEDYFLSPASGTIALIKKFNTDSEIINKPTIEDSLEGAINVLCSDVSKSGTIISIQIGLTDVHYQRCPYDAKVIGQEYRTGDFKNAISQSDSGKLRYQNEHNTILFETENGIKYKVIQVAGFIARKIISYVNVGDYIKKGDVIGLIRTGSQVIVVVPDEIQVNIKEGDTVIYGQSVIGKTK